MFAYSNSVKRRAAIAGAVVAILVGTLALNVSATEYYVDSVAGDDSNPGLSPEDAWLSLERVSNADLKPGDVVRFRCGEVWRGGLKPKSGKPGAPVVYASFGEGAKPRLQRSVALDKPSDWISAGDGLWTTRPATVRAIGDGGAFLTGGWGLHTENGAKATFEKKDGPAGVEMKIVATATGSASNHIQWTNSPFPIERGKSYRVSFDARASVPFDSLTASLMMSGAPWSGYGVLVSQKIAISNEFSRQELIFKTTETAADGRVTFYLGGLPLPEGFELETKNWAVEEVDVDALELAPDVGNIILISDDGSKRAAFKRWTLDDLKAEDDFWYDRSTGRVWYRSEKNPATRFAALEAAVMSHIVNLSRVEDAVFDGLDLRYGGAHGFGGSANARCVIRNCDLSWIGGGDQYAEGGDGRRVRFGNAIEFWADARDHLVENCRIWEVYDAAITNQGSGVNSETNIVYRNNLIWNCEYSFEYWNRGPESTTANIEFVGNTCLRAGRGWGHVQRPDKNGRCLMFYSNEAQTTNFVVRDNVFADATDSLVRSDVEWTPERPRLDGNRYWQVDASLPIAVWEKSTYSVADFDKFREAAGQEANGRVEPFDVDAAIPTDVD